MIIKKIGVIITSLIFITALSLIPVKADEIVSTEIDTYSPALTEEENKQIIGAKYLVEYLRQGGSIDLSNSNPNYTAEDLIDDIADFFNGTLAQLLGDEGYWINNISETQVPTYINLKEPKISSNITMMLGLLPYLTTDTDNPTPELPEDYSYLNTINDLYFLGYNAYTSNYYQLYSNRQLTPIQSISNSTIISSSDSSFTNRHIPNNISYYPIIYYTNSIQSIYVNQVGNQYIITYPTFTFIDMFTLGSNKYNVNMGTNQGIYVTTSGVNPATFQSTFNTLNSALQYVYGRFSNINLYVDNQLWIMAGQITNYHIDLGQGTYVDNTNQPIQYDYPEPTKIDLTDLIDRLDLLIANQNKIKFPDFSDLIVDEDGQQAVAVVVVNKDLTIDDWYVTNYGTLIPLFPVFVDYPVSMTDVTTIATVGIKDVIPSDILEIFGIALVGMLFVTWIHRLLE